MSHAALLLIAGSMSMAPAAALDSSTDPAVESTFDAPLDLSTPLPLPDNRSDTTSLRKAESGRFATRGWNARVDIEQRPPILPWSSELALPSAAAQPADGAARVQVTAPSFDSPISWDKVSIETRVDPLLEQGQVGTKISRSVSLGSDVALTVEGGYSVTQSLASVPVATSLPSGNSVWGMERRVRLRILPSDTTITVGSTTTGTDWLRSVSTEQKLFGGPLRVFGSLSETATGEINRSVKAGFTKAW